MNIFYIVILATMSTRLVSIFGAKTRKKMALEEKNVEFAQTDLPELLAQYYQRLFPYSEFYRWLSYGNGRI